MKTFALTWLTLILLLWQCTAAEDVPGAVGDSPDAAFWAVVSISDHTGEMSLALIGLSRSSSSSPELKDLQAKQDAVYKDAKAAWDDRRKAYEADRSNGGASYRKVEAEPQKPAVKLIGRAEKEKSKAEEELAKFKQKLLAQNNPGLVRRKQVMNDRLLQHFTIGIQATPEWIIETKAQHGANWACMAGYLSHVVDTPNDVEGNDVWFFKYGALRNKFIGARNAQVICWSTWYGLAEAPPARYQPNPPTATPINAKVQSTMIAYWSMVKKHMLMAKEFEDVDCVLQIEPDEWGHLLLSCNWDYDREGVILVGGSGLPEFAGLPDSVRGYASAFRVLRDLYAPHVLLAANPSAWDRNGSMTGENWGKYFNGMDVNVQNGWDLFITQVHDWDTGQVRNGDRAKYPPYKDSDIIDYFGSIDNWCAWIKPIHDATGMWGVAWQLPQGNSTYATCDGSDGHGMDGIAELLLDKHPSNGVAARMAAAGCCMWIFSLGGGGSNVTDAKQDGITNPTPHSGNKGKISIYPDDDGGYLRLMGSQYFQNPVPILGKPVATRSKKSGAAKDRKVASEDTEEIVEPAVKVEQQRPKLVDAELRSVWTERLRTRTRAELTSGKEPQFSMKSMGSQVTARELQDNGDMVLSLAGSGEMMVAWRTLNDADFANLALALLRADDPEGQALAAFFSLLSGNVETGRECLRKALGHAEEVERAFGLAGDAP